MTVQRAAAAPQTLGLALLIAIPALAIGLARAPYLHDFAEWLYQAQVLIQLAVDPPSVTGFSLTPYPVPNSMAVVLLAALSAALPPVWAGKLFLCAMLVGWFLVIRAFCLRWVQPADRASATLLLYGLTGLAPFAEHILQGLASEEYALQLRYPCQRCIVTTIDQDKAVREQGWQPYKTLVDLNPMPGKESAPAFGQNASLLRGDGVKIAVGDQLAITGSGA